MGLSGMQPLDPLHHDLHIAKIAQALEKSLARFLHGLPVRIGIDGPQPVGHGAATPERDPEIVYRIGAEVSGHMVALLEHALHPVAEAGELGFRSRHGVSQYSRRSGEELPVGGTGDFEVLPNCRDTGLRWLLFDPIVVWAVSNYSVSLPAHTEQAPVFSSSRIGIIDSAIDNDAIINLGEVVDFGFGKGGDHAARKVVSPAGRFKALTLLHRDLVDVLDSIYGILTGQKTDVISQVEGGGFPKVFVVNIPSELARPSVISYFVKRLDDPHGWALISYKTIPFVYDSFARQSSRDEKQDSGYLRPTQHLLVVGCIVLLGGFVLLFKVLDQVYLNAGFNVKVAVCGFFLGLLLVPVSGGIIFCVFRFVS